MHIKEEVSKVGGYVVRIGGFMRRRKRAAIALLVVGPLLLTGEIEVFVLNGVGLLIAALLLRRLTRSGARKRADQTQRAADTSAGRTQ